MPIFRCCFLVLITTLMAISASGNSDLKITFANASYDLTRDTTPPPTRLELIERAHQEAIKRLGSRKFHQVSQWIDSVSCYPVGSSVCYSGHVQSTASFIAEEDFSDNWQIHLDRFDFDTRTCTLSDRLINQVREEARFFCNGEIVLPPLMEHHYCEQGDMLHYVYSATFQCIKAG